MMEINLYIDESGNMGKSGRYFLICALEVDSNLKKSITKRAGRVINRFKIKKNISKTTEIKGWNLSNEDRLYLLNSILYKGIKVRYIVLDLEKTTMLLEKSDDKNACYNYLVQLLIKNLVEHNKKINKINIHLDNRTVKVGNRLSLKQYLYNKLVLEKLEINENVERIDFEIHYLESESCYLIEWADIVANSLYKKYNSNNGLYYKKIKPFIAFESKFPSNKFGK